MPDTPSIAVVIPCYNDGEYLGEALQSLFSQDFADWEAVVVDDCSREPATVAAIGSIHHPQAQVIRHPENRGLSAARNTGIRATTAPIVFPLDADDRLAKGALRAASQAFRDYPDAGLVYSDVMRFGAAEGRLEYPEFGLESMLAKHYPHPSAPFLREFWLECGGFSEDPIFRLGMEDVDFHYSMLEAGCRFQKIVPVLYWYRARPGGLSGRMQRDYYRIRCEIADRHPGIVSSSRRQAYLHAAAVRAYRANVAARDVAGTVSAFWAMVRHSGCRPGGLWRTAWNTADAWRARRGLDA